MKNDRHLLWGKFTEGDFTTETKEKPSMRGT